MSETFTQANLATLQRIAAGINWRLDQRQSVHNHMARIIGPGNSAIYIRQENQRWKISGHWPSMPGWQCVTVHNIERDHPYKSITVSPSRNGCSIAVDIRRRLLSQYLDGLAKVNNYIADRKAKEQKHATIKSMLAAHLPVTKSNYQRQSGRDEFYLDKESGAAGSLFLCHAGGAELALKNLSIEQVFSIFNALKGDVTQC